MTEQIVRLMVMTRLAEQIRLKHLEHEEAIGRDIADRHPLWADLPVHRRQRWLAIAHTAMEFLLEEPVCRLDLPWALTYARSYWKHGSEPQTQVALTLLAQTIEGVE